MLNPETFIAVSTEPNVFFDVASRRANHWAMTTWILNQMYSFRPQQLMKSFLTSSLETTKVLWWYFFIQITLFVVYFDQCLGTLQTLVKIAFSMFVCAKKLKKEEKAKKLMQNFSTFCTSFCISKHIFTTEKDWKLVFF